MKNYLILFSILWALIFLACSTSKSTSANIDADNAEIEDYSATLLDYLRKVPGVTVVGDGYNASVTIRGATSITGPNEPLFVLDGQILSGGLQEAMHLVPVGNIKSVRILKSPSEKAIYGVRGANGIIKIILK